MIFFPHEASLSCQVEMRQTNFVHCDSMKRVKSKRVMRAFDADGTEHQFTPESHVSLAFTLAVSFIDNSCKFKKNLELINPFFDRIGQSYVDGKPLHVANPEESSFYIISFVEFQQMTTQEIQARLRRKNVVVTGHPCPDVKYDAAGLRTLCPLHRKVSIQGKDSHFEVNRRLT